MYSRYPEPALREILADKLYLPIGIPSLAASCMTWVTVGSIAAKAASAKPVLALRYE